MQRLLYWRVLALAGLLCATIVASQEATVAPAAKENDLDGDGILDSADGDIDGDGIPNEKDAFPRDPKESKDTDGDGIGDNADTDLDGDGIANDLDGDVDGDGIPNEKDAFPRDSKESKDTDKDGIGDNADTDLDGDGIADSADGDIDGDGIPNEKDAFPRDATESKDTDGDGIGDNADTDTPVTTSHKPLVHGEGQPSIAGWKLWFGFTLILGAGLYFDFQVQRKYSALGKVVRGAFVASVGWVGLALFFALFLMLFYGLEVGFVFATGYLVEESLSVDNLVVIAMIFKSFRIHAHNQGPVLKWGIWGAVIMRLIFIFAGVWLLEHIHSMIYIFGGILLWSAYKMYMEEEEEDDIHDHASTNSLMMKMMTAVIPYHPEARGQRFIEHLDGRAHATPMLAALIVVELSDLLFAVDSIPCILGLTHDLFLVFSSNMFAILGLRSLYLLLAELMDKVKDLKTGLAIVLAFVGGKMMLGEWCPIGQGWAVFIIFSIVGATVAKSVVDSKSPKKKGGLLPVFSQNHHNLV